jgi:hypothetical protein
MTKLKIYQVERVLAEVEIEQEDLITIAEAARLRGVEIPAIARMMDAGSLPTYQLLSDLSGAGRIQRFTSRSAVEALGKAARGNKDATIKRSLNPSFKDSYIPPTHQHGLNVPALAGGFNG